MSPGNEDGKGVPQDDQQAAAWYGKAAEQGHPLAQLTLGQDYYFGKGVLKNDAKAYAWLSIGIAHSDDQQLREAAMPLRDQLARMLPPDALTAAQEWTRTWKPRVAR